MASFPSMLEIPISASTQGWSWEKIQNPGLPSDGFWLGTDLQGGRWLTKLRGSFYAYREIVFARLVQRLGWSCQSSMFVRLDRESAAVLGRKIGEVHSAHWYLDEHASMRCGPECSLKALFDHEVRSVDDLVFSGVSHLLDWPKSELAAYIFGGNEPPGRLFTATHEFVIIDSEQMFSTGPCQFDTWSWLKTPDGAAHLGGHKLAEEVCREISSLPSSFLSESLVKPSRIKIDLHWPIAPKVSASIKFARAYLQRSAGA